VINASEVGSHAERFNFTPPASREGA
jgi:hypothetical protein